MKETILKYSGYTPSHGDIRLDVVFDEQRDHYALMQVGWDGARRVKGCLIYITLKDGEVHVEYDGMEWAVAEELKAAGVKEEDLVLTYLDPIAG